MPSVRVFEDYSLLVLNTTMIDILNPKKITKKNKKKLRILYLNNCPPHPIQKSMPPPRARIDLLLELEETIMPRYQAYEFAPTDLGNPQSEYLQILDMLSALQVRAKAAKANEFEYYLWRLAYQLESYYIEQVRMHRNRQCGMPERFGLGYYCEDAPIFAEMAVDDFRDNEQQTIDSRNTRAQPRHSGRRQAVNEQRQVDRQANVRSQRALLLAPSNYRNGF